VSPQRKVSVFRNHPGQIEHFLPWFWLLTVSKYYIAFKQMLNLFVAIKGGG
jgi:hypothetical protein